LGTPNRLLSFDTIRIRIEMRGRVTQTARQSHKAHKITELGGDTQTASLLTTIIGKDRWKDTKRYTDNKVIS
jgi:hypothetical protein